MSKIKYLWIACILACVVFTGCKKDPEELNPTKPIITSLLLDEQGDQVWTGEYNGETPFIVKINVKGDFDLKTLKVETVIGTTATEVETVTSFSTPKDFNYERGFEVPDGVLSMGVRFTAENVKGLSNTQTFTMTGSINITIQDVINALSDTYTAWWPVKAETEAFPDVAMKGTTFNLFQMFDYSCQSLLSLNSGGNRNVQLFLNNFDPCPIPDLDNFADEFVSFQFLINQSERQINYGKANDIWANYVGYGTESGVVYEDPDGTKYQGRFSLYRGLVCLARLFDEYKKADYKFPTKISSADKNVTPPPPPPPGPVLALSAIVNAFAAAYDSYLTTKIVPETITIGVETLEAAQYYEAAARAILAIRDNETADIEIKNYNPPAEPDRESDGATPNPFQESIIPIELVYNTAQRQLTFAGGNGIFANYVSYPQSFLGPDGEQYNGFMSFNRSLVIFARALAAYKTNSVLPAKLSALFDETASFQSLFIDAYSAVYKQFEQSGAMPQSFIVDGQTLTKPAYFEAACRVLLNLYNETDNEITITPFIIPNDPTVDGFEQTEIHIELLVNVASRNLTYVTTGGGAGDKIFANCVVYPSGNYTGPGTYSGNFSFNRALVVLARALYEYKTDGSLPAKLSSAYTSASEISVTDQQAFVDAFDNVYNTFLTNDKLPATITVNGKTYERNQWFEVACRMLLNIKDKGNLEPFTLSNFEMSENPNNINQDTFIEDEVGIELVTNQARRQITYAGSNRRFANFVGYPNANTANPEDVTKYNGNLSLERGLILMMRVCASYKTNSALPETISSWQSDFLHSTLNCEVGGTNAVEIMTEAIAGKTTEAEKAKAIFEHWLDMRSYEYYQDTKQGSENTLESKTGNCCDLTHALVALARTAGIRTRYVHAQVQFSSGKDGHVWAELYVNGAWVTCDPSNGSNTYGNHENWTNPEYNSRVAELSF